MFVLYIFGICLTVGAVSAIECPDRWVAFRESCYLFGYNMSLTFVEAEHYCKQQQGHLAHVDNAVENAFVKDYAKNLLVEKFWIGLSDDTVEGVWQFYDTMIDASFFDWAPGQPDDYRMNEDCVMISRGYGYYWGDSGCNAKIEPICEIRDIENIVIG